MLSAFGLSCTLKRGHEPSSTQRVLDQLLRALVGHGVNGPVVIDLEHVYGLPPGTHAPDFLAVYEVRHGKIAAPWFPPPT